ncbi:F0F1 ATP synthase subunit B' [uncultured Maricaulis sp.]|uniref:F0F1 ATP synthase subunit B family protein n=1 Tax=uncultured Maricaulis sp. TaxID=174710 RepID=UPI0030D941B1|tara:strand:- start:49452 stop:50051 length:600 start_codon:yes stop_codon:yes gene_type:complete
MINFSESTWLIGQAQPHGEAAADQAHAVVEHAAETHASSGLPQLDVSTWPGQLFWLAVTFTVLFMMMWKVVLPRIRNAIEERRDRIADDLDTAADLRQKAADSATEYERLLSEARAKAHGLVLANRAAVDQEMAAEADLADLEIAKRQEAAEERIADMRTKALAKVNSIAVDATRAIITSLTGAELDDKSIESAVSDGR